MREFVNIVNSLDVPWIRNYVTGFQMQLEGFNISTLSHLLNIKYVLYNMK